MNLNDCIEGRWMTPDLLGGDITNPQSLNRYAYALNNPTTLTDPSGLDPLDDECDNGWEPDPACEGASGSGIDGCGSGIVGFCPPWIIGGELNIGIPSGGGTSSSAPSVAVNPPAASPTGPFNGSNIGGPPGFQSTAQVIQQIGVYASPWEIEVVSICAVDPECAIVLGAGAIAAGGAAIAKGLPVGALALGPYIAVKAGAKIYQARSEQRYLDYVARKYCVDRNQLGRAIEEEKRAGGRGGADNLSKEQIEEIAKTLPRRLGCVPQG